MHPTPPQGGPKELAQDSTDYSTDSLDLAAWLVCHGFSLLRLQPPAQNSTRRLTHFVFEHSEDLVTALDTWESGQPVRDTDLRRYIGVKKDLYHRAHALSRRARGGVR